MIDFLFTGLITPEERRKVLKATQVADAHRYLRTDQENDPECEEEVRKYVPSMPADLLGYYHSFQQRLGYAVG